MTVETVTANEEYILTIHIDAEYLRDEDTLYPITIDPTIEISYTNNGAGAIQDIVVNSADPLSGTDGEIVLSEHHKNNITNNLFSIPFSHPDNYKLAFMGHVFCWCDEYETTPLLTVGAAVTQIKVATVENFNGTDSELKTAIHELGHLFGANDHYGVGCPSTEYMRDTTGNNNYDELCIYGESHGQLVVGQDQLICDGCAEYMQAMTHCFYDFVPQSNQ